MWAPRSANLVSCGRTVTSLRQRTAGPVNRNSTCDYKRFIVVITTRSQCARTQRQLDDVKEKRKKPPVTLYVADKTVRLVRAWMYRSKCLHRVCLVALNSFPVVSAPECGILETPTDMRRHNNRRDLYSRCWFYFGRAVELNDTFLCSPDPDPTLAALQSTSTVRAYQYGRFQMYASTSGIGSIWFAKHEFYTYALIESFYTCGISVQPLESQTVSQLFALDS